MEDIGRADYLEWKSIEILWVVIYKISTFLFGNEYDAITNNVREPGILLGLSRLEPPVGSEFTTVIKLKTY